MNTITYRDMTAGDVALCRELSNQLFAHQANMSQVPAYKKILGDMSFETRLKPSFEGSAEKQLLVAFDGETPIGYVFSTAELMTAEEKESLPPWAPEGGLGFYPDWLETPVRTGHLNNLYVLPQYRGQGVGKVLADRAMAWLRAQAGVKWLFVHVSNGNTAGPFYERYGFQYSHPVLGGLIDAYYQENSQA